MSQPANAALIAQAAGDLRALGVLLFHPFILLGLFLYSQSAVCWLAVLSRSELSFAYPLLSLGYIAILLIGWLGFHEEVSGPRWMGVLLIGVGIVGIYSEELFIDHAPLFAVIITGLGLGLAAVALHSGPEPAVLSGGERPMGLILLSIFLGLAGQHLFKAGMNRPDYRDRIARTGAGVRASLRGRPRELAPAALAALALFLKPYIAIGLTCYFLGTVLWLKVLSIADLSFAYPMLSLGYVLILLMGWLVFRERVTRLRWFGVGLICTGLIIIHSESLVRAYGEWLAGTLTALAGLFLLRARQVKAR